MKKILFLIPVLFLLVPALVSAVNVNNTFFDNQTFDDASWCAASDWVIGSCDCNEGVLDCDEGEAAYYSSAIPEASLATNVTCFAKFKQNQGWSGNRMLIFIFDDTDGVTGVDGTTLFGRSDANMEFAERGGSQIKIFNPAVNVPFAELRIAETFYSNGSISLFINETEVAALHDLPINFDDVVYFQTLQAEIRNEDIELDDFVCVNGTSYEVSELTPPTPEFTLTVVDAYDGSSISNFTVILFNSTDTFINTTTAGSINYENLTAGIYNISINSTQDGGYFNLTFGNVNVSNDFAAAIYQAILRINATEVISNNQIIDFNVSVSLQNNKSNSSGFAILLLKADSYNISIDAAGFQTTGTNFSIGNLQDNILTMSMGTANLTVTASSSEGVTNNFHTSMILLSTGATDSRETTTGKVVFPTIAGVYNITLNATGFAFASQQITVTSGDTLPNVSFNLFSTNSINITIFDEETNLIINYTTVTLIMDHIIQRFTNTTDSGEVFFTELFDGLWNLLVSTAFHSQREYIFTIVPQTTSSLNVYLLNTTNGELKTFTVKNKQDQTLPDSTVSISNRINNTFVTVDQGITNFAGQVNIFLSSSNEYRFTIEAAGFTTKVFDLVPVVNSYNIIMDPTDTFDFTTIFDKISFTILPSSTILTPQVNQNFSIITSSELGFINYFGLKSSFNTTTERITNVTGSPAGGTATILINTTLFNSTTIPIDFFIKLNGEDIINVHRDYRTSVFITPGNFSAVAFADKYKDRFSNVIKSFIIVMAAVAVILSLAEMGSPAIINGFAGAMIIIAGAIIGWIPGTVAFIVGFITIGMYFLRRGD